MAIKMTARAFGSQSFNSSVSVTDVDVPVKIGDTMVSEQWVDGRWVKYVLVWDGTAYHYSGYELDWRLRRVVSKDLKRS